jgi:hypothetical protein
LGIEISITIFFLASLVEFLTPNKKFTGLVEFTFQASDGNGASNEIATVLSVVSIKIVDKSSVHLDCLLSFIFIFIEY